MAMAVVSTSAAVWPSGTATRLIGIVRNRSITPRCASCEDWNMPVMMPPAAVAASRPGTRNARYSWPGVASALPKTKPKNSSIVIGMVWVRITTPGECLIRWRWRPRTAVLS